MKNSARLVRLGISLAALASAGGALASGNAPIRDELAAPAACQP